MRGMSAPLPGQIGSKHRDQVALTSGSAACSVAGSAAAGSTSGQRDGRIGRSGGSGLVLSGNRELAPDDLAGPGAAGAPAVRDLAYDLQASTALVVVLGVTQPRYGGGVVEYLDEQAALEDQAQANGALRIPNGVCDQFGNGQFGDRDQIGQAPPTQWSADQRAGPLGRGE